MTGCPPAGRRREARHGPASRRAVARAVPGDRPLALLAARTHYSRSSWERWLNGKRLITTQALLAFAELAGVAGDDVTWLLALLEAATAGQPPAAVRLAGRPRQPHGTAVAQLPAAIRHFAGRDAQVATLRAALTLRSFGPGQVGVTVVSGSCGIGTSAAEDGARPTRAIRPTSWPSGCLPSATARRLRVPPLMPGPPLP